MPRMTNAKSAPVLNSADDFERKLNWQLFVTEQEALLAYDPSVDEDGYSVWNVGDPINDYMPWETVYFGDGEYGITYGSAACYRPMIELIHYDGVDTALKPDCDNCDVLWDGNEPCFVCGGPRNEPWPVQTDASLKGLSSQVGSPWDGLVAVAAYSPSESLRMLGAAMAESFQEVAQASERAARAMQPVVRRAVENERGEQRRLPEQIQGRRMDYMLFDEAMVMSMYPSPEQARFVDQARAQLANSLDIPVELLTATGRTVPSFAELLPPPIPPLSFVPTAQNPQNTRRRPRITPDTNRSYPTSEPNWRCRRPRRA